ncbi:HAD-IA family hydrolase [Colwellia sp. 1_MG-2023]|uniref:HAD-IA family hydrolase n=1 Tax=unclassified Colwellia TaxID=196834 RepID=UPI001C080B50|nr:MULTISPECIES: HAD-IA family hydrolase [unclassified Colwellia]MBU2924965.1 HAD-IA family hydrolase [Colwellia sp. C2M11]MDO6652802.1 HAD-IA family hydrolase [Colwellia sp. 3_MG-2023]MDO6665805.1 HAD-IA family hydrolase [Colwellia sp. 2_MG-2023]MDO6690178.1 HAD-IA family hydrolase [Colwellia sp. 1_MG-2023]
MKFYRRLTNIKAISFDLDDTLYSNKPVMVAIEKKMIAYFANLVALSKTALSQYSALDHRFWNTFRQRAVLAQPDLVHDVVRIRLVTYRLGFMALGLTENAAEQEAQTALDYFVALRSDFIVPAASKALLASLSEQYPLVAISNGNVDTKVLGIADYFQHIYHAGWQADGTLLRQKPMSDMFELACHKLAIKSSQLLHVGDCGRADIQGALQAGCQAAWLSCYDVGKPITVLPHIELSKITQLNQI